MKVLKRYLIVLVFLIGNSTFAQSFITKVSAKTIGKKDVLQIDYVAENVNLDQFVLPNLNAWTVISGPNFSSSTLQNGKLIKEETSYSVMVQPKFTGKMVVPGATALINNKPQRSNTLTVEVKDIDHVGGITSANPPQNNLQGSLFDRLQLDEEKYDDQQFLKKGENAKDKIRNNILIKLDVNKQSCYVGEPILATYKLCTRVRSESRVVKQPMFNGCTVIEMTGSEEPVARRETINGRSYNVYVIRKVQLFPLAEGKLLLPQASVENKVKFYDASNFNYRDLYYNSPSLPVEEQQVTLQNAPITVDVKALPPYPSVSPSVFSGAVGRFDVDASANNKSLEVNTTNQLEFTIIGDGNLQEVKAPEIKWPQGLEAFDPTEQDEDDKTHYPVAARKTFSFPFVASKKGTYVIPPIQLTYFDPKEDKYVTKVTAPLTLHITAGSIINIKSLIRNTDESGFENRLYIILGAALIAVIIGLVWYNERHKVKPALAVVTPAIKQPVAPTEVKEPEDASKFIFAVRDLQPDNNSSNFYKELCKNLNAYIEAKYQVSADQVEAYIQQRLKDDFTFDQLNSLLQNCSLGMYTPVFTVEEAMEHRLLAIEILNKLEKA